MLNFANLELLALYEYKRKTNTNLDFLLSSLCCPFAEPSKYTDKQ